MMRLLSFGASRHAVIIFLVFSYFSGYVLGKLSGEIDVAPRGVVSITRGIMSLGVDDKSCDFAGNIVLGGFFSLEPEDKFFTIGSHQLTAYNMVVDQINAYQCGVKVKEKGPDSMWIERNYALELRTYGDQSSTSGVSAVAEMLATDSSVDIMVGGYSSTLTHPFVEVAHKSSEKLVLAAGSSSTKVYVDKDLAFGLLPPSNKYISLAIEALATIHGAQTIATVWEDSRMTRSACGSAPDLAEKYGMTMTSATEVVKTPNTTVLEPIAESLMEEDPDVVITCVYDCNPWLQAMRRTNWSPKAQIFTVCVGQENFSNEAGSDASYIMGVTPWDSSLQIKDTVTGWSASEFASRFRSASMEDETSDVPYQAAMAASLISILHQSIQGVNKFRQNGPQLADYISSNTFQTMGGNLAFDNNGQLQAPSLTIQYDKEGVIQIVYPPEVSSGPMLYPMPTWDHRDCINLSTCQGEKENSTDPFVKIYNKCDNKGICVCNDPLYSKSVGSGATANCIQLEEKHYINRYWKVLSWIVSGLLLAFCTYCLGWTYYYRENSLVKVSQPLFLAFLVVGSMLSIVSMLTMGVEASYREDTDNIRIVDAACMATPWLWGMGFAVTYSALFAKVWRIHKLCKLSAQMRRKVVDYKDVFYIIFIVLAAEMIVLIAFQVTSPLIWERDIVDDVNGYSIESIGRCTSENSWWWQCILVTLNVICLFIALVLCWRTKDLPSDFSESNYIFLSVMFMFQILLMTLPVTSMVREDSNVLFFVRMCAVFLQNFSVLALIFFPKMRRIFLGEDTTMSIKNAMRQSITKSSLSCVSPSKLPTRSLHGKDQSLESLDIEDVFVETPNSLAVEPSYGKSITMVEWNSFKKSNKTEENKNEKFADNKYDDYKVRISKEESLIIEKQLSRLSWRYEASSGGSAAS